MMPMVIRRYFWVVLIVISGITTTLAATYFLFTSHHHEMTERFSRQTIPYFGAVSAGFHKSLDQVAAVQAYFQSAANVSREQFAAFAGTLIQGLPGIQAIEWVPRVSHERRQAFEASARFHGFQDFTFLERSPDGALVAAGTRDEYYPVYYVEPLLENLKAIGFDLASNPVRREALVRARDSGRVVLTRRITLVQETGNQFGFLAFHPVYRRDLPSQTVAERQQSIKGFALGVYRIGDIVTQALAKLPALSGARVDLYDISLPDQADLLYTSAADGNNGTQDADASRDKVAYQIDLPDENAKWQIVFSRDHAYSLLQMDELSWFTFAAGLLLTTMAATIVLVYMNRASVTESLVEERTRELKVSEEKALQMATEAEIANSAKSNFLATMSHEIRTPLNGVLGMAQLLKGSRLNAEQGKQVDTILSSGRTLLAIINDVLDMSKIEAGGIELEITAFSLKNLFSSVSTPFQSLADDKGIALTVSEITQDVDILKGDPVRLRQIVWNLLSNAVKFTDDGQVALDVSVLPDFPGEIDNPKDVSICISVQDTGTGISEDRLPYIFDVFTQEDTSITRKFGGSGLGLSIVKRLVDLMGGTISATSEVGKGTCFQVILPFDRASDAEKAALAFSNRSSPSAEKVEALHILLAEDNTVNAMIAEAFIKRFGHSVVLASNGREAVESMARDTFDLVLMDIHMPEMNGVDATRKIRQTSAGEKIPIIGLTAEAFAERHAQFREAGMNDVLTKPFTENQLRDILLKHGFSGSTKPRDLEAVQPETAPDGELLPIGDLEKLREFKALFPKNKVDTLLREVKASVDIRISEIETALRNGDSTTVRQAAHSIVGMSGSMFAVRLCEEARQIETFVGDLEAVRALFPDLVETAKATNRWWETAADS